MFGGFMTKKTPSKKRSLAISNMWRIRRKKTKAGGTVTIRLTDEELQDLMERSERATLSTAAYVKEALMLCKLLELPTNTKETAQ